ncbi:FG-GAP repeat domain-containing protein [Hyalangium versicolor]|uniref:FG-GAP repeat domain-containing protein n=1 Tax=Hyalangium versicolor TaxID=2861190 RepID=UPI001CC99AA2|nr:VCBS repeat-containing protein [Hyalangium versicolor]
MRRAQWQWLLVGVALVWGASGCSCGEPPVESQLAVSFVQPTDGQRLALTEDADPATDGFQYEVVAEARDTADRPVKLVSAKLEQKTASDVTWKPGPDAVIDGATVRFPGTLLEPRTNLLQVTVEEEGSHRTATRQISVTVSNEPPSVELTQPSEGQVLRETDDADPDAEGYQLRFSLRSSGLAGKAGTLYCENACGVPPTDFTVNSSGLTQVSVTLTQSACETEEAACYAVVRNGTQEVTSAKRNIQLDTVAPRIEVASPVAPVATTTFKVEATVGCTEPGVAATLARAGVPDILVPVGSGGVTFPAVTVPTDGQYTFTLRVADSGGNVTTREIPVTVASTAPTLKIVAPKTIDPSADADGNPSNGIQLQVQAQANSLPEGTEVRFFTSVTGRFARPQRAATVQVGANREASFTVNLAADRSNTLQACVSNVAGLEQCTAETVSVAPRQPTCAIISPEDSFLVHPTSALPVQVRVDSGVGAVTVVAIDSSGVEKARVNGAVTASSGPVSLSLPELMDGEYRLVATCPGATSQSLSLGVDTLAPTLEFHVHGEPVGQTTLGSELNDTSLSPGMQISLDVTTEPRASVTATGCDLTAGVTGQADANGVLLLRNISVPAKGTCQLQLTAEDLAKNTFSKTQDLTLAFAGGALTFLSPAVGRYLGPTDGIIRIGGGLTVSVRLGVEATANGTLRLLRGATEVASIPVAVTDQEKTFNDIELEEGANVLRAELIGPGGTTACVTVLLLVDTQPGNITLEIPSGSPAPVYLVRSDATPGKAGIQAPLKYNAPGASSRAVVDICTSVALTTGAAPCRDGSTWFTLAANVPSYVPDFTYPDGRYGLKAVLEDGVISTSLEVAVTVDSIEPVVSSVELLGDKNGDKRLNADELHSNPPELRIKVDGLEDGRSVQVRSAANLSIVYGQASATGGQVTVPLSAMPTGAAADYSLVVTVTDQAGNPNRVTNPTEFYPLNTAAFFSFGLDPVVPGLVLSAPTRTALGIADDASAAAGFQLRVAVNTDADVGTGGVHMELSPGGAVDVTPSGLEASREFTLPSSGTYILTIVATDTAGNHSETVTRTLTVDLDAPTVTLVTPAANTLYNSTDLPVQVNVEGADVSTVRIVSQMGSSEPVTLGDLQVVSGVAQGTLNFPVGVQTVTAQASDPAGNSDSDSAANVEVRVPGCAITITTPASPVATLLAQDDRDPATAGLQYRLAGNTFDCRGREVSLYRGSSSAAEATTTANASTGDFFFDLTLVDGEQTRLTVDVFNAVAERSVDFVDVTVDISPPLITSVSPSPTTLFFVADTNAFLFPTPAPDHVVDLSPGGDANAKFTLTVTQGAGSKVQAFYQGNSVSSEFTLTGDPETLDVPVTLPQDTTGTFEIRVQDVSGNIARHTVAATVDVVPPDAPTVTRTLVTGQERAAKVQVAWTASGDDGLSGVVAGYDLRWTINSQLPNGIADQATFFSPKVMQETGALLPAATTSYTLTLPPLARYSIQLRPRDEIGNYAPFQATPAIDNFWRQVTVTNPGAASSNYGLYIASRGDLNADGRDDLVVAAASGTPGTAYVYYGSSDPAASPPVRQDLTLPETGSQFYGSDFDVGDVGNTGTDQVQDLLVGVRGYSSTGGRAFLYFGRKGTTVDTTGPIEFRNVPNIAGASLGGAAKMIGDINGDGLQELVLSSHAESPPKVYLFYGRSQDAWRALGTGCSPTASCVVATSSADKVFSAPAGTPFFGRSRGYVRLGDITGDGVPDFTIPSSHETLNNVYVYSGGAVRALPGSAVSLSDALQVLHQDPNSTGNAITGFGTEAVGGVNLAGGPGLDLVVGMATQSKVFVYRDGTSAGFTTPPLVIQGGGRFGNSVAQGDLNGDGRPDIAIGQNFIPGGSAFVFYNRGVNGAEFDTQEENGFAQSKLESTSALGISVTILDFNGDGKPDLAAGDSQSNPARVVVYY